MFGVSGGHLLSSGVCFPKKLLEWDSLVPNGPVKGVVSVVFW